MTTPPSEIAHKVEPTYQGTWSVFRYNDTNSVGWKIATYRLEVVATFVANALNGVSSAEH